MTTRSARSIGLGLITLGTSAAVVGYAWLATGLRPFTSPALVATLAGGLAAIVVGGRLPPSPASPGGMADQHDGERRLGGTLVWVMLTAATAVWQLQAFLQHPRSEHPTLSSLTNDLLQSHPSRTAAMVAWLAVGVWLARR